MYQQLSDLKTLVNTLIDQQGEDAQCASFVYTKTDVFYYENDNNKVYLNETQTNIILQDIGNTEYIFPTLIEDRVGIVTVTNV